MEASKKAEAENTKKLKRRASYSAVERQDVTTPRRKRRPSEDMSTPTRQSMRLLNTPKKPSGLDESVGDMGIIVEETSRDEGGSGQAQSSICQLLTFIFLPCRGEISYRR